MKISADELAEQVAARARAGGCRSWRKAEKRHKLPAGLLLAVASRETNMEDKVGDGGHGRGLFQIDDRFHGDWLAQHGAPGAGTTPRLADAAEFAAAMLASNLDFGSRRESAPKRSAQVRLLRVQRRRRRRARGLPAAAIATRRPPAATTARDVLERLAAIQARNGGQSFQMSGGAASPEGRARPERREVQARPEGLVRPRGARASGRRSGSSPGRLYGAAVEDAVREFQMRNALDRRRRGRRRHSPCS